MNDHETGERDFALFCSAALLIIAAFALIGAATICRWVASLTG